MLRSLFISSTGTDCGKTHVSLGIVHALRQLQHRVAAIKPLETGCQPDPLDALALANACSQPALAHEPAFYRAGLPLSPYAVSLQTGQAPPGLEAIATRIAQLEREHDLTLIEGAGGVLVPLDARRSILDLVKLLACPLLLVAPDRLGVLSHVLTAAEVILNRDVKLSAVMLTQLEPTPSDDSSATNQQILAERLGVPVLRFEHCSREPAALIRAANAAGVIRELLR